MVGHDHIGLLYFDFKEGSTSSCSLLAFDVSLYPSVYMLLFFWIIHLLILSLNVDIQLCLSWIIEILVMYIADI